MNFSTVEGVEIFAAGLWTDSQGQERKWGLDDLDKMLKNFNSDSEQDLIPIKVGHTDDTFNNRVADELGIPKSLLIGDNGMGAARLGHISKVYKDGDKLKADFDNVPEQITAMIQEGMFNSVSVEIDMPEDDDPHLSGIAILGAELPAVGVLASLDQASVFSFMASGRKPWITASFTHSGELQKLTTKVDALQKQIAEFNKGTINDGGVVNTEIISKDTNSLVTHVNLMEDTKSMNEFVLAPEDLPKLYEALGVSEDATIDDVLAAIMALKGEKPEEEEPVMELPMSAEDKDNRIAELEAKVSMLTGAFKAAAHEKLVMSYTRMAEGWKGVSGKPEEIGKELAEIHNESGEKAVKRIVAQYQAVNREVEKLGVLAPIGTVSKDDDAKPDEFQAEVEEYARHNGGDFNKALAHFATNPAYQKAFSAYVRRVKVSVTGGK